MRTPLLRCTVLSVAIGSLLASPAQAADWNGSYIANGQCFCVGAIDSAVGDQLVPTPIGSQSVAQICERIGAGPELVNTDGIFNYPVYEDPQCGHGPFVENSTQDDTCSGAHEPGVDCQSAGPNWSLQSLYVQATEEQEIVSVSAAVTGGSRYVDPSAFRASDDSSAEQVTVIEGVEVVTTESVSDSQLQIDADKAAAKEVAINEEALMMARQQKELEDQRQKEWQQASSESTDAVSDVAATDQSANDELNETNAIVAAKAEEAKLAEQTRLTKEAKLAEQKRIAEEAKLAEQKRIAEEAKLAEQKRIAEEAKLAEQKRIAKEAKLAEQARVAEESDERSVAAVAESTEESSQLAPIAALQLPAGIETNYNDFEYVQALPLGYDFGGGGMAVSGSYSSHGKWHYFGRAGVADSYNELFVGAGYYLTPPKATRMTVVATAGLEYGRFQLTSGALEAEDSDSGLALSIASRIAINHFLELQAGVGYSSFFGGDIHLLGGGFIRINKQLDLTSQFEIGDNDSFGLGIRYYY